MKTIFVFSLLTFVSFAHATTYRCVGLKGQNYPNLTLVEGRDYTLEVSSGKEAKLTDDVTGKWLLGKYSDYSYVYVIPDAIDGGGNMLSDKKKGYMGTAGRLNNHIEWYLAVKTGPGAYQGDRLECEKVR